MTNKGCTILLWALILGLSGCAAPPKPPTSQALRPPPASAPWEVRGKASLTTATRSDTVNLHWSRSSPDLDHAIISGPVGLGAIALTRTNDQVRWQDGDAWRPLSSLPLDSEARAAARQLPLPLLGDWLIGHTSTRGDWSVSVTQWQSSGPWRVPRKLELNHNDIHIRLVLLEWELDAAQ